MDTEDGWVPLGAVGNQLANLAPDFDPRTFGFRKLSDLVRKLKRLSLINPMAAPFASELSCHQENGAVDCRGLSPLRPIRVIHELLEAHRKLPLAIPRTLENKRRRLVAILLL